MALRPRFQQRCDQFREKRDQTTTLQAIRAALQLAANASYERYKQNAGRL